MIRIGYDTLAPAEAAIRAVLDAGQDAFRRGCGSPLQHSFRLRICLDFSRWRERCAASQCGKTTSMPGVINAALNIALEARLSACFYHVMSTTLIEVRRAKPSDAPAIAATHDEAWRGAYQGIIPGPELDKLINRRGPLWWDCAVRKGSRVMVLAFGECVAGYANYGRNRAQPVLRRRNLRTLPAAGIPGSRLRPQAVLRGAARPGAERAAKPGDLGAVGQRAGRRLLSRARRQGGGPVLRTVRRPHPRPGRLRLGALT